MLFPNKSKIYLNRGYGDYLSRHKYSANTGRNLYGNLAGAYIYDLPILIQSIVIYIIIVF